MSVRSGTYSIVARDPSSGALGVAVQSHWFSVGSVVPWARAGVGAVATQSIPDPGSGERVLARLERGMDPAAAVTDELAGDELARFRQMAAVDAAGRIGVHTGAGCIPMAGERSGSGFSAQANMMASARVWDAMADRFTAAEGPLAHRLLAALEAAESAGGDVRGRQSAALLVVPGTGKAWETTVDLRVEDAPEPVAELRRLLGLADAYALAERADEALAETRHEEAAELYRRAAELAPEHEELRFWAGLGVAAQGDVAEGSRQVGAVIDEHRGWAELLARLDAEVAPAADAVRKELGIERSGSRPS